MTNPEGITVGRVARPWGRKGAVVVTPLTHDLTRFQRLEKVVLAPERGAVADFVGERQVRFLRFDPLGRPLLTIEGVETMSQAETLRGHVLLVSAAAAERPPGVAYFNHELIGCAVVTTDGQSLGRVRDIIEAPAGNLLELDGAFEVLIPLIREMIRDVDVSGQKIVVSLPTGLLELNDPQKSGEDR